MKTLLFSLIVIGSGYYLLSQTDSGQALLGKVLPSQQIAQTTDELLNKVDSRLQDFTDKQSAEQNLKIQQLQQQITELTARLSERHSKPPVGHDSQQTLSNNEQQLVKNALATEPAKPQHLDNDALNLPPDISQIQGQTAANTVNTERVDATTPAQKTAGENTLIRQKQASLQDIAARMEQVSLQVSNGNY